MIQQKVTPFLWFNDRAEEAMQFYTSIFKDSSIGKVTYYGKGAPMPEGTLMTGSFTLEGQAFVALNGGPHFTFSPAISFVVHCETQEEVDHYWGSLSADEAAEQCGWLKDKFGISWQIVPVILNELLSSGDSEKAARVMQAVLQMKKLNIEELVNA